MNKTKYIKEAGWRLTDLLCNGSLKYEPAGDAFNQNCVFDWENFIIQLPFQPLTQEQKEYVDPENILFTGKYNDLYLCIGAYDNKRCFSINIDSTKTEDIPCLIDEDGYELFETDYIVYGYDRDDDGYYLCGLTNNIDEAIMIAETAYEWERKRTDADRETREVPDIDCIFVLDCYDKEIGCVSYSTKYKFEYRH